MKAIRLLLLAALSGLMVSGCYHRVVVREPVAVAPSGEVVVTEAPPAPKREVITTSPSAAHVWVTGYWTYQNGRYVWMPVQFQRSHLAGLVSHGPSHHLNRVNRPPAQRAAVQPQLDFLTVAVCGDVIGRRIPVWHYRSVALHLRTSNGNHYRYSHMAPDRKESFLAVIPRAQDNLAVGDHAQG